MNMFGERQDVEKFIPKTIRQFKNKELMPVHGSLVDGYWKSGSRFYLHARNQADALTYVIMSHKNHPIRFSHGLERPHRFHVGGEREVSNADMANLIAHHMGLEGDWVSREDVGATRPGHDLRYGLERKTLEEWGWVSPVSFDTSLEKTIKWTLENPEWLQ
jgi:dTDP-glucose 4,6-dehydratase